MVTAPVEESPPVVEVARDSDDFVDFLRSCFPLLERQVIVEQLRLHESDPDLAIGMIMSLATEFEDEEDEGNDHGVQPSPAAVVEEEPQPLPPLNDKETKLQLLVDMFPESEREDLERVLVENNLDVDEAVDLLTGTHIVSPLIPLQSLMVERR